MLSLWTLVRHTLIPIQWWFRFHFTFFQANRISHQAPKTTTPAASNQQQQKSADETGANDGKMDRVLNIKANEIVRHNIIQLFDIFVRYYTGHNEIDIWQANHFQCVCVCNFVAERKIAFQIQLSTLFARILHGCAFFCFGRISLLIRRTSSDNAYLMPLFVIDFNGNLWICWSRDWR